MHKILEKLSDVALIVGGLGLILSFITYACTTYPKWVPICSQLLLFHFFWHFSVHNDHNSGNRKWMSLEGFSATQLTYQFSNSKIYFLLPCSLDFLLRSSIFGWSCILFFSDMIFCFTISYEKKGNPHLHRSLTTASNIKSFHCVSNCGKRWVFTDTEITWNRALLLWLKDNMGFVCSYTFCFRPMSVSILLFLIFKWDPIFSGQKQDKGLLNLPQISWESIVLSIPYLDIKSTFLILALPKLLNKFSLMLMVKLWISPELFSDLMGILFIYQS